MRLVAITDKAYKVYENGKLVAQFNNEAELGAEEVESLRLEDFPPLEPPKDAA